MAEDRNDVPSDIIHIQGAEALAAYAEVDGEDSTLSEIKKKTIVPIAAIVHGTHPDEIINAYGLGSICIPSLGDAGLLAKNDSFIDLVCVFYYTEFIKWADNKDPDASIVGRSLDPLSEIAQRALDPNLRIEKYQDGKYSYNYVEHLNYVVTTTSDHPLHGTPFIISMKKAEAKNGVKFNSAIAGRRISIPVENKETGEVEVKRVIPKLFTQIWRFGVATRTGDGNKWYGYTFNAPNPGHQEGNYVPPKEIPFYRKLHEEFKKAHNEALLQAEFDPTTANSSEEAGEIDPDM